MRYTCTHDMKYITHTDTDVNETYLFNLNVDPGEQKNLIGEYPQVAQKLEELIKIWEVNTRSTR